MTLAFLASVICFRYRPMHDKCKRETALESGFRIYNVKKYGGALKVETEAHRFARFTITLPA